MKLIFKKLPKQKGNIAMNVEKEKCSPMMQRYLETKEQYPDCILFYRLGDFYEMFFDDAIKVSRELEITLTGKDCGLEERAPMCRSATSCGRKLYCKTNSKRI